MKTTFLYESRGAAGSLTRHQITPCRRSPSSNSHRLEFLLSFCSLLTFHSIARNSLVLAIDVEYSPLVGVFLTTFPSLLFLHSCHLLAVRLPLGAATPRCYPAVVSIPIFPPWRVNGYVREIHVVRSLVDLASARLAPRGEVPTTTGPKPIRSRLMPRPPFLTR